MSWKSLQPFFDFFVIRFQHQGLFVFFFGPVGDVLLFVVVSQRDVKGGVIRQPFDSLAEYGHGFLGSFLSLVESVEL